MSENKFYKFAINYLDENKTTIYSYTALDENTGGVLMITPRGQFDVEIPASITCTCGGNFNQCVSEKITEEQFWNVFKSYTLQLYQYYQNQVSTVSV